MFLFDFMIYWDDLILIWVCWLCKFVWYLYLFSDFFLRVWIFVIWICFWWKDKRVVLSYLYGYWRIWLFEYGVCYFLNFNVVLFVVDNFFLDWVWYVWILMFVEVFVEVECSMVLEFELWGWWFLWFFFLYYIILLIYFVVMIGWLV